MRKLWVLVVAGLSLVSCGSESLCEQIGNTLCKKACDCREGDGCAMTQDGFSITFDSESDCRLFLSGFGCSMGDKAAYNDAAACLPLVQAAMCTGAGAEGALDYPADTACETPQQP